MNMVRVSGLLLILLASMLTKAFGQIPSESVLDTLTGVFIGSINDADREKVFVQTDRWNYLAGDDVWLRAWCIGNLTHKPLLRSRSLFVDVVNDRDSVVALIMLNNAQQDLDGRIHLPDDLAEGDYWLRAYTPRILLTDPFAVYIQPIWVRNPENRSSGHGIAEEKDLTLPPSDTGIRRIAFSPEGGAVVAGVDNKFVFTAFDQDGKPMDVFGYVTDTNNLVVAKYGLGMPGTGSFSLFVAAGMRYTAHTIYAPGKILVTPLPVADPYGYQLSVTGRSKDSVFAQVSLGDSVYKKYRNSYVVVISRDRLFYTAIGKDMYTFSFATKNIPSGKASILLFDDRQKIVSQRDIYISKSGPVVSITQDQLVYGPRQPVNITLAADRNGEGDAPTVFAVGVTDERQQAEQANGTTLLTAINHDNIEFPDRDFSDSLVRGLSPDQWDLIMLTQPFRYLGWEKTRANSFAAISPPSVDSGWTTLNGRVVDRKLRPVKGRIITLMSSDSLEKIVETDTSDEGGRFHFPLPGDISDSLQVSIRCSDPKGQTVPDSIMVDNFAFPRFTTPRILKERYAALNKGLMADMSRRIDDGSVPHGKGLLKPAIVTRPKKEPPTYDASKIVSPFSTIIPGDKLGLNPNGVEVALLSVAGVSYRGTSILIRGGGIRPGEPLLYVDGFQVQLRGSGIPNRSTVITYLESLNPRDIDFIEVLAGADASVYGPGSDNGVIYVHMRFGGRPDTSDATVGVRHLYLRGYCNAPLFKDPDYDNKAIRQSPYPDQRRTIYWNPKIITDSLGQVKLRFFTADGSKNYTVTAVGLAADGKIIYGCVPLSTGSSH
jgi:hypothetical protein